MASSATDPYPWKEPAQKPTRGAFIVIEGLDRAGKTTQVKKLCDRLYSEGHNLKTIRFPGIVHFRRSQCQTQQANSREQTEQHQWAK